MTRCVRCVSTKFDLFPAGKCCRQHASERDAKIKCGKLFSPSNFSGHLYTNNTKTKLKKFVEGTRLLTRISLLTHYCLVNLKTDEQNFFFLLQTPMEMHFVRFSISFLPDMGPSNGQIKHIVF